MQQWNHLVLNFSLLGDFITDLEFFLLNDLFKFFMIQSW